jgi:hypothetical protein
MNTLSHDVVHGPHSRQGLDIKSLYTEQGIQHIARIHHFTQNPWNMTGQLMIINRQEMKLCLGLNGAVMDHSYAKLGHLVKKAYIEWAWRFVSEYGM